MNAATCIRRLGIITLAALLPLAVHSALPTHWSQGDVGAVGVPGTGNETGGTFTIQGSGADIWGTADAFHFVHRRLSGNAQVVVRVASVQNTNTWAKAGVMIRESLAPGSKHALALISSNSGAAFQSRATTGGTMTNTTATGIKAPYYVRLTRSGNKFSAHRSSNGTSWTKIGTTRTIDMEAVVYVGMAVCSHNNAVLNTSTFSNFAISPLPALLVTASTSLGAGDAAIKKRLQFLGYSVTVKAASTTVSTDANGKEFVFISSTVSSGQVNTKFTASTVPVITSENALQDDLGMTGTVNGTDYGTVTGQTQASIFTTACNRATMYTAATGWADGCQDMAAGLTGTVAIQRQAEPFSWGKPGSTAIRIAHVQGNTARSIVYGYEKGAAMPRLASAPARRAFLNLSDQSAASWTSRGQALFDNVIHWATGTKHSITRKILVLNFDPILTTQGNVRMDQYGFTRWQWKDPYPLLRDYLADITEASAGYVRWKLAKYADIPDYLNRWFPITGSTQFNTPAFTEQQYLDGYQHGFVTGDWGAAGAMMPNNGFYEADYHRILDDYGVNAKLNAGEVHEVILFSYRFAGPVDVVMAGSTAYDFGGIAPEGAAQGISAAAVPRPTPNFFIMGLDYDVGDALHLQPFGYSLLKFGTRVERLMGDHVFPHDETIPNLSKYWPDCPGGNCTATLRNLYDKFVVVEGNLPGNAGVGAAQWAPNATVRVLHRNTFDLTASVESRCDDWQFNYPALADLEKLVSNTEWHPQPVAGQGDRTFRRWWLNHLPRLPGHYVDATNAENDGRLNNWWEYAVNFNRHPETLQ